MSKKPPNGSILEFDPTNYENGKKVEPAVMTVDHNDVRIHDQVRVTIDNSLYGLGRDKCTPAPILHQEKCCPVQFRNIWLLLMKK